MEPTEELRAAVRELAAWGGPTAHLAPEELAAYRDGALAPADAARVQDHLVTCRECLATLLELQRFAEDLDGDDAPSAAEVEAVWRGVEARAARQPTPLAPVTPLVPRDRSAVVPRAPRLRALRALAASLLVATAGLSFWVVRLRDAVDELSRPQLNAPVEDLLPSGPRGEGDAGAMVELGPDTRSFTLVLNPAASGDFAAYRLEIERAGGGAVWSGGGLVPNSYGSFSVTLSRRLVGPGEYRVRLVGITADAEGAGGERRTIGEYPLRVVVRDAP